MKKSCVIGDIHGAIDELRELVLELKSRGVEEFYFVGDFFDKGSAENCVAALRFAQELGGKSVLANHEASYLRYKKHEDKRAIDPKYKNPMSFNENKLAIYEQLSPADWVYLSSLPPFIKLNDGVKDAYIVHAGFEPAYSMERQDAKIITMVRYVNDKGNFVGGIFTEEEAAARGLHLWSKKWQHPENVIYGHISRMEDEPRIDTNAVGGTCYGIDLGAIYGGRLASIILPTYEVVSVKSKKQYAKLRVF